MSGLLSTLQLAGNALGVFDKSMGVVQDNVINASTPGYASQQLELRALPLAPDAGWYGGLQAGSLETTRNEYAEQSVRHELEQQGYATAKASSLERVQTAFDVSGESDLGGAINGLLSAFSSWSTAAEDATQRQDVLTAANKLASSFNQTASDLTQSANQMVDDAKAQVTAINNLSKEIAEINQRVQKNPQAVSATDAEMHAALEQLSELTNVKSLQNTDGTVTVLLDGQVPLVMGERSFDLSVATVASGNALPMIHINAGAQDVTAMATGGKLGGLIEAHNTDLGAILGTDATNIGSLNQLAFALTDRINTIFQSGQVDNPAPPATPTPGCALFQVSNDPEAAANLKVDSTVTPDKLAAIDSSTLVANGIPTRLAALANPGNAADKLNGMTFVDAYGSISSLVGTKVSDAETAQTRQEQLTSQAKSMRSDISGVSLDEQAALLMQFQRAYESTAQVVTVINGLMDNVLSMVQG